MKGLIIAAGRIVDYRLLKELVYNHDYIVCVDSGLDHLYNIKLKPDLVIGDLDSISKSGLNYIKENDIKLIKYPVKKNKTDTELATDYLIEKDIRTISLIGVTGSRLDHSLTNIALLRSLYEKGAQAKIVDDNNTIWYVKDRMSIKRREGYYLSLIPLDLKGVSVSLKGFLYPLSKTLINYGSSLGVSNVLVEPYGEVEIHQGEALLIESRD